MDDAPKKKKRSPFQSLKKGDMRAIFAFFESPEVDYPALQTMIKERFDDTPILLKMCERFATTMQSIDAGEVPEVDMQSMIAKSVMNMIINLGRISAARIFLAACREKFSESFMPEAVSMLMLTGLEVDRLKIVDRPWLDYQIYDRGAETTIIMMCGNSHRFGVELNSVAVWLESLQANLIYLRDYNLSLYLAGVRSIGDMEQSVARIKHDLGELGTKRLILMGSSGGVFGALNYGQKLNADLVLCFAGPTSLYAGQMEAAERPSYLKVQKMIEDGVIDEPDMRAAYEMSDTRVRYFYGAEYEFDKAQIPTLEGLPNVSIEPLADWPKHIVIAEMAQRNMLMGIFEEAVSGKS